MPDTLEQAFARQGSLVAPMAVTFTVDDAEYQAAMEGLQKFSTNFVARTARQQTFNGLVAAKVAENLRGQIARHNLYGGTGPDPIPTVDQVSIEPMGQGGYLVHAGGAAGYLESGASPHQIPLTEPLNRILANQRSDSYSFGPVRGPVQHPGFEADPIAEKAMEGAAIEGEFTWLAESMFADAWNEQAVLEDLGGSYTPAGVQTATGIPVFEGPQGGLIRATGTYVGSAPVFSETALSAFEAL